MRFVIRGYYRQLGRHRNVRFMIIFSEEAAIAPWLAEHDAVEESRECMSCAS